MPDIMVHAATTDHSSDERLMSRCLSLLQTTVTTGGFFLSLLCYYCSDTVVAYDLVLVKPCRACLTPHVVHVAHVLGVVGCCGHRSGQRVHCAR
jgi:hypothetical protein